MQSVIQRPRRDDPHRTGGAPPAHVRLRAVRWFVFAVTALAACGRLEFERDDARGHVQTAAGWTARTLVDLTGTVEYVAADFMNGTTGPLETLDNAPRAVAALYAPFSARFAVSAGRVIIEIGSDGSTTVHDYRPALPDDTGPDSISHLVFADLTDTGSKLWIGASSKDAGDGLFYVSPDTWVLTPHDTGQAYNNVNGIAFDATGTLGDPALYFVTTSGVFRRVGLGTATLLSPAKTLGDLAIHEGALFVVDEPDTGSVDLVRLIPMMSSRRIATSSKFVVAEGGAATAGVAALHDGRTLALYASDGAFQDLASSTDPAWVWVAASAPRPPHPHAAQYVVLESNRATGHDDLLLISPAE
jgi:hypothetical protein